MVTSVQSGKYQPKLILHIIHCFPLEDLKLHLKNSIAIHLLSLLGTLSTCNAVFTVVNTASVPKILPGAGDVGLSPSVFPVNVTAPGTVVVNLFIKAHNHLISIIVKVLYTIKCRQTIQCTLSNKIPHI